MLNGVVKRTFGIKSFVRNLMDSSLFFPIFLLIICLATYGYKLIRMGFYWDDWPVVYLSKLNSPAAFWSYFSLDRPFSAWTHILAFPILGTQPVHWQLFTILLRWLSCIGFWWTLRCVWPSKTVEVGWMALLIAVYPGFSQQSISVSYSQHFICFTLFTFSLGLMAWAIRSRKNPWPFIVISTIINAIQMMTMEYFIGLEILRPILIWIVLANPQENKRVTLQKTLKYWLPYFFTLVFLLFWRFFLYDKLFTSNTAHTLIPILTIINAPIHTLETLLQSSIQDFVTANIFAWVNTLSISSIVLNAKINLFSWLVGAVIAIGAFIYFIFIFKEKESHSEKAPDHFVAQGIVIGLLGFFAGGLPIWLMGSQISKGAWSDRFTLGPLFGIVVLLVSLVAWLGASRRRQGVLLGMILALAIAYQIQNTNAFSKNWDLQKEYYWQLSWRIPGLKPDTAILSSKVPFGDVAEYSVGFAINSIYNPQPKSTQLVDWFFSAFNHLNGDIPSLDLNLPITYSVRTFTFSGSTSSSLAVEWDNTSTCVHVLSTEDLNSPYLTSNDNKLIPLSNLNQIISNPTVAATPSSDIFGAEPAHSWCYYYEKAALAAQNSDWQKVIELWNTASQNKLKSKVGLEFFPFITAYAHTGDWSEAATLTDQANTLIYSMQYSLCTLWKDIQSSTTSSPQRDQTIQQVFDKYGCSTFK